MHYPLGNFLYEKHMMFFFVMVGELNLRCVCQRGDLYTVAYEKVTSQKINMTQLNAHPEVREDLIFNFRLTVSMAAGVPLQNVQVVNITAGSIHIAYKVGRLHKKFYEYMD